jgi:hypothetical protein
MPDSEDKKPSATTTELVVRNADGVTFSTRIKDEKGKFVKKPRPLPDAREVTRMMRTLLNQAEGELDKETGKIKVIKGAKSRFRKMFDNMVRIASNDSDDPKSMMAAVKAFEVVALRALGKPSVSDEEIEALKVGGVKIILIQPPQLMHNDFKEEHKEPQFLPAEVIEDKK